MNVRGAIRGLRAEIARQLGAPAGAGGRRRALSPLYLLRLVLQTGRQWARDKCPQAASSLAFETSLSIAPLTAVGFALLKAAGAFDARSALITFVSVQILPISRHALAARLATFADNINIRALGATGVVSMLALAYLLFDTVERTFNDIWRVQRRRSLTAKLLLFYAVTLVVPFLLGVSLAYVLPISHHGRWIGTTVSLVATICGLTLANKLLPVTPVRWRSALAGGAIGGALFEVAKHAFRFYAARIAFARYAGVYGPLGLVLLFLVWIYVGWLTVLFGAEVAHTTQELQRLELDRRLPGSALVSGPVAARVLLAVARAERAGGPPTVREIAGRLQAPPTVVDEILRHLERAGLARRVPLPRGQGWELARPGSDIALTEVLVLFRPTDLVAGAGGPLDRVLRRMDEAVHDLGQRTTLETLLAEDEPRDRPHGEARDGSRDRDAERSA